jgi:hypothetical protein
MKYKCDNIQQNQQFQEAQGGWDKIAGERKGTLPNIKQLLDLLSPIQALKAFLASTKFTELDKTPSQVLILIRDRQQNHLPFTENDGNGYEGADKCLF